MTTEHPQPAEKYEHMKCGFCGAESPGKIPKDKPRCKVILHEELSDETYWETRMNDDGTKEIHCHPALKERAETVVATPWFCCATCAIEWGKKQGAA